MASFTARWSNCLAPRRRRMQKDLATLKPREVEGFTREQIELIKRTVCEGASDLELQLFLYQCNKSGLDPLAKQIYFVKRKGRGTIQTGIDGYRAIADATGQYAGNDDYEYGYTPDERVVSATATVYKIVSGQRCAFTATARWDEYYPGKEQGWAWDKMPHVMLGKCAESLALRKAFPKQLSGMYTTEEMAQANGTEEHRAHVEAERVAVDYGVTAPVGTKAAAEQVAQAKLEQNRHDRQASDAATHAVYGGTPAHDPDLVPALEKSNAIQQLAKGLARTLCQVPKNSERWVQTQDELARLMNWKPSEVVAKVEEAMAKAQKDLDALKQGFITAEQKRRFWTIVKRHKWPEDRVREILNELWGVEHSEEIKASDYEEMCAHFDHDPLTEAQKAELLGDDVPLN